MKNPTMCRVVEAVKKCYYRIDSRLASALAAAPLGAMGVLAFSPYEIESAALFSLVGLLVITLNCSPCQAAARGFIWGMGLFTSGLQWVYLSIEQFGGLHPALGWILMLLLTAYLAVYPALFCGVLARWFPAPSPARLLFAAPALWHLAEWLRGELFSGFPWLQFGYTQVSGPLTGVAPIGGVGLVTLELLLLSGAISLALATRRWRWLTIIPLVLLTAWPLRYLMWVKPLPTRTASVALVQGNIMQPLKWKPDQLQPTLQTYWQLTKPLLSQTSLIIWPEMAIPATDVSQRSFLNHLSQQLLPHNNRLLTGISHQAADGRHFNSILLLGDSVVEKSAICQAASSRYYHKHHLVPFGEFVPFASLLRPLAPLFNLPMSSFSRGPYRQPPLLVGEHCVGSALCYEIILGQQIRHNFTANIDFLLTLSNDAWFGNSAGPWQHLQMARMRALELGRPLLRATNNGVTAIVNHQGTVLASLPQFTHGVLTMMVTPTTGLTPYARFGDALVWLLTAVSLTTAWVMTHKRVCTAKKLSMRG